MQSVPPEAPAAEIAREFARIAKLTEIEQRE